MNDDELDNSIERQSFVKDEENPFLILGFLEFAIIATLTIVFFPWSLLFSLIFYGMEQTKFLLLALFHDFVKTLIAVLTVVLPLGGLIIYLIID